eukprot:m.192565 g.192565  ORF g.192565 m.192565 type:complete len:221 (+) comp15658_c0_seq11:161-823(+)
MKTFFRYYFIRENLDVQVSISCFISENIIIYFQAMQAAANAFVGSHDFRNYCKMDIAGGITNYNRTIISVSISSLSDKNDGNKDGRYEMCVCTVVGQAFLWHQIRNMMAILFMVGHGQEKQEIVSELLDVEKTPRKPQYDMASELPLVLYNCEYKDITWQDEIGAHSRVFDSIHNFWKEMAIKAVVLRGMLDILDNTVLEVRLQLYVSVCSNLFLLGTWG